MNTRTFTWQKTDLCFAVLQAGALSCAGLQAVIAHDVLNLQCVAMVLLSSSLVFQYLWRSGAPRSHPVSSLALLGLTVTNQFTALVVQTVNWTPFVSQLRWPVTTFLVLAAVHLIAVAAHWVYRHLAMVSGARACLSRAVLTPLGLMEVPPALVIWLMAGLGLFAMAAGGAATGDAGGKFVQAYSFLAYAPFLIPVYLRQFGDRYAQASWQAPLLFVYVLLMLAMAVGLNARQLMAIGPVQVALMALLYFWWDAQAITWRTLTRVLVLACAGALLVTAFAQLAVAMVLVRDKRDTLSRPELIRETVQVLFDGARIRQYEDDQLTEARHRVYEETYLRNPVLSRFSETKFHDNNIHFATLLHEDERDDLWRVTREKAWAILPQTVLDALDIDVHKDELGFSFGDYFRYLHEGADGTLGGFATGSVWAHTIGLFGLIWSPFVVFLVFVPSFLVLDAMALQGARFFVSPPLICSTWLVFEYALAGESLVWKLGFYLRDLPQKLLLYALAYAGISFALRLLGWRPAPLVSRDEAGALMPS